jgi:micrococcal nuclease
MKNNSYLVNSKFLIVFCFAFLGLSFSSKTFAHNGRLASDGCHKEKTTGERHCHDNSQEPKKKIIKKSKEISITSDVIDSCYDGDTCTTTSGEKIRLACIDTPEIRGPNAEPAKAARDFLNSNVAGKEVSIRRVTEDKYGRTVGELAKDGVNIQKLMVSKGYAKIYKKYADPCPWASNFSGDISDDNESSPIENSLSCPNFVLAGGKKYCL